MFWISFFFFAFGGRVLWCVNFHGRNKAMLPCNCKIGPDSFYCFDYLGWFGNLQFFRLCDAVRDKINMQFLLLFSGLGPCFLSFVFLYLDDMDFEVPLGMCQRVKPCFRVICPDLFSAFSVWKEQFFAGLHRVSKFCSGFQIGFQGSSFPSLHFWNTNFFDLSMVVFCRAIFWKPRGTLVVDVLWSSNLCFRSMWALLWKFWKPSKVFCCFKIVAKVFKFGSTNSPLWNLQFCLVNLRIPFGESSQVFQWILRCD